MTPTRSLEAFVRLNTADLRAFALSRGVPWQDCPDVIQSWALARARDNALASYNPQEGPYESFIYTSFVWAINDYWRGRGRLEGLVEASEEVDPVRVADFRRFIKAKANGSASRLLRHMAERVQGDATCNSSWSHEYNLLCHEYLRLERL